MVEEEEEHVTPHSKLIPGAPTFVPKGSSIAYVSSPLHWGRQLILAGSNVQKVYVSDKELIDALWGSNVESSDPFHFLNESWSPAISVCRWVGVICGSRHQRVKSLKLSNFALTGRIPRDFGNLTFLVSLDLGNNHFHGNLPQEMAHLRRLKFLDLSLNSFRGEIPSWFGFLHQLQVVNLRSNSFTGSIPPSLSNASRLEILEISTNLLEGNIPEEIGNLHNLKSLSIEQNQLTGSIPFTLFNISRIEVIAFSYNSLSGDLPNGLCNDLPILKELLSIQKQA
ncbi:LRR receptor-like serine/threonine-protein kinase EFR [Solanum tuberosum]|uniref:LRR receptor-like serine/threonine-protein kinase EFR n=1 Tax=Solanum tuberosum TaxID=4113 RepID=UPI00073A4A2C|nr:PREDICTED: LRR receptor-like serine/threonine-protein kinase EFR [Solanum tuberosum]